MLKLINFLERGKKCKTKYCQSREAKTDKNSLGSNSLKGRDALPEFLLHV